MNTSAAELSLQRRWALPRQLALASIIVFVIGFAFEVLLMTKWIDHWEEYQHLRFATAVESIWLASFMVASRRREGGKISVGLLLPAALYSLVLLFTYISDPLAAFLEPMFQYTLVDWLPPIGRTSPQTSFIILLLCGAMLAHNLDLDRVRRTLAVAGAIISASVALGYIFYAREFFQVSMRLGISIPATVGLLLLCLSVLALDTKSAVFWFVFEKTLAARLMRTMLPVIVLVPLLLDFAGMMLTERGLLSAGSSFALNSLIGIAIIATVMLHVAGQLHREIESQKTRLQMFVEYSPAAIAMFDNELRYLMTSVRWLQDYGLVDQNIVGKTHYEVFPEVPERWRGIHARCLAGAAESCEEDLFERADGSRMWLRWEVRPWHHADGTIGGIIMMTVDVTEKRLAAEKLRLSEERFALAVKGANDGIWDWQITTDEIYLSDRCRQLAGIPHENGVFRIGDLYNLLHPDDRARVEVALTAHLQRRVPYDEEYRLQVREGEYRWFRARGHAVWDEAGKPTRMSGSLTDISNQKSNEDMLRNYNRELWQIKDELERQAGELAQRGEELESARRQAENASRVKTDFLANMSHEIRTPMNAILGYAELLLSEEQQTAHQQTDALQTIRRNGEHLLAIINDILDISKIEAGKVVIEHIPFNITHLISEVASLLRVRAQERSIGFEVEYVSPIPQAVVSDPTRIRQILMNLVSNAIKFTHAGRVVIRVSSLESPGGSQRKLRIEVEDTGIGISEIEQARLFQAFAQADATTTRKFGGTGLGLAISRRLAEMLGGQLLVCSQPGKGSTFAMVLPIETIDSSQLNLPGEGMSVSKEYESSDIPQLSGRILLAEDGLDNQRLISLHLRKAGAEVEVAENGAIAIERVATAQAQGNPFDLIFMDMQMPELDGYSAIRRLRDSGLTIPIIALTAHAMASDKKKCLEAGCTDYRTKPIDKLSLLQTAGHYLQISRNSAPPSAPATAESAAPRIRSSYADDPDIATILGEFVKGLPETVQSVLNTVRQQDIHQLKRLLHQIKGSGGGYGFDVVSAQAAEAEQSVKQGASHDEIAGRVESLVNTLRNIDGYDISREGAPCRESS